MKTLLACTAIMVLLMLNGCIIIGAKVQPDDTSVQGLRKGQDCTPILFNLVYGNLSVDKAKSQVTLLRADPNTAWIYDLKQAITRVRSVELTDVNILGFGSLCIVVVGE